MRLLGCVVRHPLDARLWSAKGHIQAWFLSNRLLPGHHAGSGVQHSPWGRLPAEHSRPLQAGAAMCLAWIMSLAHSLQGNMVTYTRAPATAKKPRDGLMHAHAHSMLHA